VRSVALLPALALIAGAVCAPAVTGIPGALVALSVLLWAIALLAWRRGASGLTSAALALGFCVSGAVLAADAAERALHS
jgi:hypothetical protein